MQRSFTLIELIVVIAIIAVLAAIVAVNAFRAIEKAKISKAMADFKTYKSATYAYYADTGVWPIASVGGSWAPLTDNGFLTNLKNLQGWDGPYLEKVIRCHPWAGIYGLDCVDRGRGPQCDLGLFLDDRCCATGIDMACRVPLESAQRIDFMVDDNNTTTGSVTLRGSGNAEVYWVIAWDTNIGTDSIQ